MKKERTFLLIGIILLSIFGLIMIYSASNVWSEYKFNDPYKYIKSQGLFLIVGYIALFIISKISYLDSKGLSDFLDKPLSFLSFCHLHQFFDDCLVVSHFECFLKVVGGRLLFVLGQFNFTS